MSECTIPVGIIGSLVAGGLQAQQRQKEKDTQMNSLNWNMIQCELMIQGHSSENRKYANLSKPRNITFLKVHNGKSLKNDRKYLKNYFVEGRVTRKKMNDTVFAKKPTYNF